MYSIKTYRINRLFWDILTKTEAKDKPLFGIVILCVCIDVIILLFFGTIWPMKRKYFEGELVDRDEIQKIQYLYGVCVLDTDQHNQSFANIKHYYYGNSLN